MKSAKRSITWCLLFVWLTACVNSPSPTATAISVPSSYPIIPIPPNVLFQSIGQLKEGIVEIDFYADSTDYPTESGATSYRGLLGEEGWRKDPGSNCDAFPSPSCPIGGATDTLFLGIFQYGQGPNPPTLVVGINTMIQEGEQTTLWVKNCGAITATHDSKASSKEGCLVLLPDKLETPKP